MEDQHHLGAAPEEDVPPVHPGDFLEAQHVSIKAGRRVEIAGIEAGLEDGSNGSGRSVGHRNEEENRRREKIGRVEERGSRSGD
jgi:hypothetical protein